MPDTPESRYSMRASRRTVVIRKAADDDALRKGGLASAGTGSSRAGRASSERDPGKQAKTGRPKAERRTSIIVKEGKHSSGRFIASGPDGRRESFRLKAGDTVVRHRTGETLIRRRVAHKSSTRRQLIVAYVIGYLVVFGLYAVFLLTATHEVRSEDYLLKAFGRRLGGDIIDLERAAYAAMRGNRTPAEVRFAEDVTFYDDEKNLIKIHQGDRVTLPTAAKLGLAIIEDLKRPLSGSAFQKPFKLYEETWLASVDWQYWLMCYNLFGFFLLCALFLWKPISDFLATQGNKTASALDNARKTHEKSEEIRDGYRKLAADLEKRREEMESGIKEWAEEERAVLVGKARSQAADIARGVGSAVEAEVGAVRSGLTASTVAAACRRADELIRERCGQAEHDAAIDDLIAEIEKMRLE